MLLGAVRGGVLLDLAPPSHVKQGAPEREMNEGGKNEVQSGTSVGAAGADGRDEGGYVFLRRIKGRHPADDAFGLIPGVERPLLL